MDDAVDVLSLFGGKPPRLFWRLLRGDPRAWGHSARAARGEVLLVLATRGLTIVLEDRRHFSRRYNPWGGPGHPGRRTPDYMTASFKVGIITDLPR